MVINRTIHLQFATNEVVELKEMRKEWRKPTVSELDISQTYGFVDGPHSDSNGKPSDKS